MPLFELTRESLVQVPETWFDSKLLKSKDLQRLLRRDISVLSPDLKVIAEDYGGWENDGRSIDILCIDKEARLVVVDPASTCSVLTRSATMREDDDDLRSPSAPAHSDTHRVPPRPSRSTGTGVFGRTTRLAQ